MPFNGSRPATHWMRCAMRPSAARTVVRRISCCWMCRRRSKGAAPAPTTLLRCYASLKNRAAKRHCVMRAPSWTTLAPTTWHRSASAARPKPSCKLLLPTNATWSWWARQLARRWAH